MSKKISVLNTIVLKKHEAKKLFGVIAGPRLGGKTTLAGTLPGKTLLLQSDILESGCESAQALAARNEYELDVANFETLSSLQEIIGLLASDEIYDNVYIDGLSAMSEMRFNTPEMQAVMRKDNWAAFRQLGQELKDVILELKKLTYPNKATKAKNVFITCALLPKQDKAGNVIDTELEVKGRMAVTEITKVGEFVGTVMLLPSESGEYERKLVTKTFDMWPGRIDALLDDENPGIVDPDLGKVLNLIGK